MDFWRGEAYTKFFEFLDSKGGFYYEVRCCPCSFSLRWVNANADQLDQLVAVGRCPSTLDRRGAVRAQRPAPLLPRDRI